MTYKERNVYCTSVIKNFYWTISNTYHSSLDERFISSNWSFVLFVGLKIGMKDIAYYHQYMVICKLNYKMVTAEYLPSYEVLIYLILLICIYLNM